MASQQKLGQVQAEEDPIFDDPSYQRLSEIRISVGVDDGYEDPTVLLNRTPSQVAAAATKGGATPTAKPWGRRDGSPSDEALGDTVPYSILSGGKVGSSSSQGLLVPSTNEEDYDSDSSVEAPIARKPTQIRQSYTGPHAGGSQDEDSKLYVVGTLIENKAPLSFKSHYARSDSSGNLEDQGIYQGLVMTNSEKERLGIMPESIYMTANLEQWGNELEHMSLKVHHVIVQPPSEPATAGPPRTSYKPRTPPIGLKYRGSVLRPPPLPPLDTAASEIERKMYSVVENLLKSEAAFLTSLHIAIQTYMRPLMELSMGPSPILDKDQVVTLFGPIQQVIGHHELFYTALTTRTMEWTPVQRVGDIFMSSFNRKEVVKQYSEYVNNFTDAMEMLETAIKKRPKFVAFLKEKYALSKTSLSLQGLLLKPIQRFPQYILFLQDLLKSTRASHPDQVHLQMALARLEGIAEYLNEAKRRKEQLSIVHYLTNKITGLPFKLVDSKRWLQRQDVVTRVMYSRGEVVQRQRSLLLFNNMVLCASLRHRPRKGDLESSIGSKDFRGNEGATYACKWFSPLDVVQVDEPDYNSDIWDHIVGEEDSAVYQSLKTNYKRLEHDFMTMTKIATYVVALYDQYQGLRVEVLQNHLRVLQRKLARAKEQIMQCQPGRLDILIPSRDGTKKVHHTYVFESERVKRDWLNAHRYAKLKMMEENKSAWVFAEDPEDEDVLDPTHKLPLFVDNFSLSMYSDKLSVECAAKVGANQAWFASGDNASSQVTIVECVTPCPIILECFKVPSARIMGIAYVPPAITPLGTFTRQNPTSTLTILPPYMPTVWMGSQCGKLLIYHTSNDLQGTRRCIASCQFPDSITCLGYFREQVYVATAQGNIIVYTRSGARNWNLSEHKTIPVHSGAIKCVCAVGKKRLWVGVTNLCYILNMETHIIESRVELNGKQVKKMASMGAGVWVSYRGSASLELYHSVTHVSLQQVDIKATLSQMITKHKLEPKLSDLDRLNITSLMTSSGYLWVGTSVGALLVYRIPHLEAVPIITGKPYLANDGHQEAVRVLLTVKTLATLSSTRVDQFISDEQTRNICFDNEQGEGDEVMESAEISLEFRGSQKSKGSQESQESTESITQLPDDNEICILPRPPDPLAAAPLPREEREKGKVGDTAAVVSKPQPDAANTQTISSDPVCAKTVVENGIVAAETKPEVSSATILGEEHQSSSSKAETESHPTEDQPNGTLLAEKLEEALEGATLEAQVHRSFESSPSPLPTPLTNTLTTSTQVKPATQVEPDYDEPESWFTVSGGEDDHDYEEVPVEEPEESQLEEPSPYEDPATLEHVGPIASPELFAPMVNTTPTIPGRSTGPKEGAIFVLTAGRGLVNLRPGKRRSVIFPTSSSKTALSSVHGEGCMVAYEIEH